MRKSTRICTKQVSGNLHITLYGRFTPIVAARLVLVMEKMLQERGTIIIHTGNISNVTSKARAAFEKLIGLVNVPQESIYFFGKKGLDICSDKQRIIFNKKHEPAQRNFTRDSYDRNAAREESFMGEVGFLWEERIQINKYKIT